MNVSEASLDALVSLARQHGHLSTEDLRRALPIDQMSVEDISNLIIRLEEADINLEIDRALLLPPRPIVTSAPAATSKHAPDGLPKATADARKKPVSSPDLAVGSTVQTPAARTPTDNAPAHGLIWVFAFVIAALVLVIVWAS